MPTKSPDLINGKDCFSPILTVNYRKYLFFIKKKKKTIVSVIKSCMKEKTGLMNSLSC